ncbi:hypothetical protein H5410_031959 [Solanum commersonii]|uniref:Uncharacterized protein n=1 Tax=Solanum commersonii TaxID=4109 RepID=A0A9J5YKR3_SOLCO|nr:hypothetical protein H5410_031959 [Solanum commersonii]
MSMKTLAMKPVGHDSQNNPFSRSNNLRSRTLVMEPVGHQGQNDPFSRSNEPHISLWIFVHTKFHRHLFQKFTWASIKSLAMELVGHHCQTDPFSRSNEPHMDIC